MAHHWWSRLPALVLAGGLLFSAAWPGPAAAGPARVSAAAPPLGRAAVPEDDPTGTLAGDVRDAGTNSLIPGAVVQASLSPTLTYSVTAASGAYSLTLPVGGYTVTASAAGYAPATLAGVAVLSGTTTTQDFSLAGVPVLAATGHVLTQIAGNANGRVDQGEIYALSIGLTNQGLGTAQDVTGTLALDSGDAALLDASASYSTIAPGATVTPAQQLRFQVGMAQPCAQPLSFTFTAGQGLDAPVTYPLTVPVGATQIGITQTFASTNVPLPIPDAPGGQDPPPNPGITSTLDVAAPGLIADLNVRLDSVAHPFVGDLVMRLISPQGTLVPLMNQPGENGLPSEGDNFLNTILDDAAAAPISGIGTTGPFTGRWQPDQPLAAVNGQPMAGAWRLNVRDAGVSDAGTLEAWSLEVRELILLCEPFAVRGLALTPAAALGSAAPGAQHVYSLRVENTGNMTDTFSLAAGPHQWPLSLPAQAGPLPAGAHADVPVTVTVPLLAALGASDPASITVTSQGDAAVSAGAVLTTTAIGARLFFPLVYGGSE